MTKMKLVVIGAALATLSSSLAWAQPPSKMPAGQDKMMSGCMAMSHDDMMKNSDCMAMMQKMKMSDTDMTTMKSCQAMTKDAMMKDKDCMSMSKMHPGMMMSRPK